MKELPLVPTIDLSGMSELVEQLHSPLHALYDFETDPVPFFVVLPSGLGHLEYISSEIESQLGARPEMVRIDGFEQFARHIYPVDDSKKHSYLWLALNRNLYGNSAEIGYAFLLPKGFQTDDQTYASLVTLKRSIREQIGVQRFNITYQGETSLVALHHIHAPDFHELSDQHNALLNFTKLTES